jgi:Bacterial sugar transferase
VVLLVRLKLGSPVLFRHQRPGIGDKPLILLKFRTMTDARDPTGELLPDERRITQFGQATVRGQDIASDRQATSRKRTFHIHMLTITEWSTAITNLDRLTFFPSDTGF